MLAIIDWPVLASCTNNLDLLEEISLVPSELYLRDLAILIEMYEVRLDILAVVIDRIEVTHYWQSSSPIDNEGVQPW